jgi:predicted DsbA family dithiol-disulfide isomerase
VAHPTKVDIYIDYVCPWAYRAALWMRDVKAQLGDELEINWKFFSLEQVNADFGDVWKVWDQPISHQTKGFIGFRGAIAARQQGEDAFEKFHFAWFEARHGTQRRALAHDVAAAIGLDMDQFARDFDNPDLFKELAVDHEYGAREYGVFGTPTFVFENGENAYFQIREVPTAEDTVKFWNELKHIIVDQPTFQEIKRPYHGSSH